MERKHNRKKKKQIKKSKKRDIMIAQIKLQKYLQQNQLLAVRCHFLNSSQRLYII